MGEDVTVALGELGLPAGIRACLFDLDGVLTRTATVHRAAWREMFDPLLRQAGQPPFTEADYLRYVDGKHRCDGVRDFLASRGLVLPEGTPDDPPSEDTVAGVGSRKNVFFSSGSSATACRSPGLGRLPARRPRRGRPDGGRHLLCERHRRCSGGRLARAVRRGARRRRRRSA